MACGEEHEADEILMYSVFLYMSWTISTNMPQ